MVMRIDLWGHLLQLKSNEHFVDRERQYDVRRVSASCLKRRWMKLVFCLDTFEVWVNVCQNDVQRKLGFLDMTNVAEKFYFTLRMFYK